LTEMYLVLPVDGGLPAWEDARLYKPEDKEDAYTYAKEMCLKRDIPASDKLDEGDWFKGVDVDTVSGEFGEPKDAVHVIAFEETKGPGNWMYAA